MLAPEFLVRFFYFMLKLETQAAVAQQHYGKLMEELVLEIKNTWEAGEEGNCYKALLKHAGVQIISLVNFFSPYTPILGENRVELREKNVKHLWDTIVKNSHTIRELQAKTIGMEDLLEEIQDLKIALPRSITRSNIRIAKVTKKTRKPSQKRVLKAVAKRLGVK